MLKYLFKTHLPLLGYCLLFKILEEIDVVNSFAMCLYTLFGENQFDAIQCKNVTLGGYK